MKLIGAKQKIFLGVAEDTRSDDEKELDALHEEVAFGLIPAIWKTKKPEEWKHYTLRNQNLSSYDCCAFSTTTGMEADLGLSYCLSARDIYDQRSNYPSPGMIPFESVKIPADNGVVADSALPSDNLTEAQLNTHVTRSPQFKKQAALLSGGIPTKLTLPIDIDEVASLINQGMTVRLCFRFDLNEWTAIPQLLSTYADSVHHQVIGVDFTILNGQKMIVIQDSCFPNTTYVFPKGLRAINADFLSKRCYSANYIKPTKVLTPPAVPEHIFTLDIQYGDKSNEVLLLQTKLQSLGYFHVEPTGYFGGLTKQAVIGYQAANGILQTGYVGPITRASLNK